MNERIKELAMQAYQYAVVASKTSPHFCSPGSDYFHAMEKEKFAELIVQECMRLCKDVEYFDIYDDPEKNGHIRAGAAMCREDIKEHFGVE